VTRVLRLASIVGLLLGAHACKPESARRADRAAQDLAEAREQAIDEGPALAKPQTVVTEAGKLAKAEAEFRARKALRIQVLRGEHSVIATQRLVIGTMATGFTLTDAGRADVNERLTAFKTSLGETQNLIDGLERVDADAWTERQDEATEAMTHLDDVRDAAWHTLDDALKAAHNAT
jgi:hypothetical protein